MWYDFCLSNSLSLNLYNIQLQGNEEAVAEARRHLNDSPILTRRQIPSRTRADSYVPLDDEVGLFGNHDDTTRDLSNLKLAQNQQALSKQIDQLAELVRVQAEELKMVRALLVKRANGSLDE
jgi:hypothetical protein